MTNEGESNDILFENNEYPKKETTEAKYERLRPQVFQLEDFDRMTLLAYLMGFFSRNEAFLDTIDSWLNDPQFGRLTRPNRKDT